MKKKNAEAVKLGRKGGLKTAMNRNSAQRIQAARNAALSRWKKVKEKQNAKNEINPKDAKLLSLS